MRISVAVLFGFVLYAASSPHEKLHRLQYGKPPVGTRIALSSTELKAWVQDEALVWAGYGASNIRFTLGSGRATGYADVDFLKARKAATGQDAGWLVRNLFSGKKPMEVTVRFSSARGRGRVDLERVEVNGIAVTGPALDYLIQDFVRPIFPDARVGEWFPMDFRIDHFTVSPGGVMIAIGK